MFSPARPALSPIAAAALLPALALALPLIATPAAAAVVSVDYRNALVTNGGSRYIDLDGDRVNDLRINDYFLNSGLARESAIQVFGLGGAEITGGAALSAGARIDASDAWLSYSRLAYKYYFPIDPSRTSYSGAWVQSGDTVSGYLGFRFGLADGTHYGWLGLTVDGDGSVRLGALGWEDVAERAIAAGSTESLADLPAVPLPATGLLLSGALGLIAAARRRRG